VKCNLYWLPRDGKERLTSSGRCEEDATEWVRPPGETTGQLVCEFHFNQLVGMVGEAQELAERKSKRQ
jgi:hypothetical protein